VIRSVLAVGALLLGSAAGHRLLTARDRRRFPPPGLLVDVGGHRLHLDVKGPPGSGPTVVLEAGMGSFSANWYWVHEALADDVRTVAYDRAGLGWSEPGPGPRDGRSIAVELRTALRAAGVDGPFVLVGHSFGGLPVRAFADLYPAETAGIVLVDASHPDQWERWPTPHADRLLAAGQRLTAALAPFGVLRLIDLSASISAGLPPRQVAELKAWSALRSCASTELAQLRACPQTRAQLRQARPLGNLPVALIGVGRQPRGGALLTQLQTELLDLSDNTSRRVVADATHESLVARQEHAAVVVDVVRGVVREVVGGVSDPSRRGSPRERPSRRPARLPVAAGRRAPRSGP
jgi:pimeloyl-ACP methyl ester carboxylesterase